MRVSKSEQNVMSGGIELKLQGSTKVDPLIKCTICKHFDTTREARSWHEKNIDIIKRVFADLETICKVGI